MSRDITPFGLRMPADLKARIDAAAVKNGRSINAEVVARLQESFQTELATRDVSVQIVDVDTLAEALASKLATKLKTQPD